MPFALLSRFLSQTRRCTQFENPGEMIAQIFAQIPKGRSQGFPDKIYVIPPSPLTSLCASMLKHNRGSPMQTLSQGRCLILDKLSILLTVLSGIEATNDRRICSGGTGHDDVVDGRAGAGHARAYRCCCCCRIGVGNDVDIVIKSE